MPLSKGKVPWGLGVESRRGRVRREEKRPPRGPAGLWGAPGSRPARARPAARKPARGPPGRGGVRGRGAILKPRAAIT